jgi:Sugar (and other) transporter
MDNFRLDGFRLWLQRATRVEDEVDWSVHTIDYASFKRRLHNFSKRRAKLRAMMRNSLDGESISKGEVEQIIGPRSALPPNIVANADNGGFEVLTALVSPMRQDILAVDSSFTLGYVPFVESQSTKSDGSKQSSLGMWPTQEVEGEEPTVPKTEEVPYGQWQKIEQQEEQQHTSTSSGVRITVPRELNLGSEQQLDKRKPFFFNNRPLKRRGVMSKVSNAERHEIVVFLAWEVDKVAMFYLAQWQRLSQMLVDFNSKLHHQQSHQLGEPTKSTAILSDPAIVSLGEEILELMAFCVINIVTVRQVLIRYDAFARTFEGTPMLHYYMKQIKSFKGQTSFRKILQHEELNALADSFQDMCQDNLELATQFQAQRMQFDGVLASSYRAEATSSAGHIVLTDNLLQTLRHYFMLGLIEDRLGYEPSYLLSRGKSLTDEMRILADWRNRGDSLYKMHQEEEENKLTGREIFNLVMALLAGFFYCMNYYIVEPSSVLYVNALGAPDAMAGALIGMMPLASFSSSIFFSIWTNRSFRHPLLLSATMLLAGNILYSAAYNFKSVKMALAGRFLTGLGGPKCIIRRYMADTTSMTLRTTVNACFGMVVAAGSAFGPGVAILLNKLNYIVVLPFGLGSDEQIQIPLNGLTGPGYFMATMWALFLTTLIFKFEEPDRSGLEEQKRMEAAALAATSRRNSRCDDDPTEATAANPLASKITTENSKNTNEVHGAGTNVETVHSSTRDDDWMTVFSSGSQTYKDSGEDKVQGSCMEETKQFLALITTPVRICLGLLFAKVFVIESLVSATSVLSKNRYGWKVRQVGTLGCVNGMTVIPLSIMVGRLSMSYQDRVLMTWLLSIGLFGLFLLIDITDLFNSESSHYNEGKLFAVSPPRYVVGYFLVYMSIQSFEGVIGSTLSKVIPTALAAGTLNSGLLATLVDTFGRASGDLFISLVAFIDLRQLMNLLFIPAATILATCLIVVRVFYDVLAV